MPTPSARRAAMPQGDLGMSRQEVIAELLKTMAHPRGPIGRMEDCEREQGHTPIPLGATSPIRLPAKDWHDGVITKSADGRSIRIVAIAAKKPGRGAFRRLLANIKANGYTPVIVAPMGPVMPSLLRRWGWQCRIVGVGLYQRDEWSPPERPADA